MLVFQPQSELKKGNLRYFVFQELKATHCGLGGFHQEQVRQEAKS